MLARLSNPRRMQIWRKTLFRTTPASALHQRRLPAVLVGLPLLAGMRLAGLPLAGLRLAGRHQAGRNDAY